MYAVAPCLPTSFMMIVVILMYAFRDVIGVRCMQTTNNGMRTRYSPFVCLAIPYIYTYVCIARWLPMAHKHNVINGSSPSRAPNAN